MEKECEYCKETDGHMHGKVIRTYEFIETAGYKKPEKYRDYLEVFILKGKNDDKAGLMIDNINGARFVDINYCMMCR